MASNRECGIFPSPMLQPAAATAVCGNKSNLRVTTRHGREPGFERIGVGKFSGGDARCVTMHGRHDRPVTRRPIRSREHVVAGRAPRPPPAAGPPAIAVAIRSASSPTRARSRPASIARGRLAARGSMSDIRRERSVSSSTVQADRVDGLHVSVTASKRIAALHRLGDPRPHRMATPRAAHATAGRRVRARRSMRVRAPPSGRRSARTATRSLRASRMQHQHGEADLESARRRGRPLQRRERVVAPARAVERRRDLGEQAREGASSPRAPRPCATATPPSARATPPATRAPGPARRSRPRRHALHQRECLGCDGEVGEARGEARDAQHAHRVLDERRPDVTEQPQAQIARPSNGSTTRGGVVVLGHRVDRRGRDARGRLRA